MLEKLEARIAELEAAIEKSAATHNGMVGMLIEAKNIYQLAKEAAPAVEQVIEAVAEVIE